MSRFATRFMRGIVCLLIVSAPAYAECDPRHDCYVIADYASVDKIDAHVHLNRLAPELIASARHSRMQLLTINVDYPDFPPLAVQKMLARSMQQRDPLTLAYATTFGVANSEQPDWLDKTWTQLRDDLAHGAVAVKVWKNIGMSARLSDGSPLMIDNARLAPIFSRLAERGAVVLGHQAEPRNCWLPLTEMTTNGDRSYFRDHPQYHLYGRNDWPDHAAQLRARDAMLAQQPDLRFVAVHLASLEWDVARVAEFLDRFPNTYVDLAARMSHVQLQSVRHRDAVRAFFVRYATRIVYGSDLTVTPEQAIGDTVQEAEATWQSDWAFLAGDRLQTSPEFDGAFRGLALPRTVVRNIYHDNAKKIFATAWTGH